MEYKHQQQSTPSNNQTEQGKGANARSLPAVSVFQQNSGTVQRKENKTGLPDDLKTGVENLSGYAMDDVKVHYNSAKPAQLNALAYAQGTEIHVAPGQERHLPHEAWHIVQQKQGRVQPTASFAGSAINDNPSFEKEADIMGMRSFSSHPAQLMPVPQSIKGNVIQLKGEYASLSEADKVLVDTRSEQDYYLHAKEFELLLGRYASIHSFSLNVADNLTFEALAHVLHFIDLNKNEEKIADVFGTNEHGNTGSVGKDIHILTEVFRSGNFREKMTLIYNAYANRKLAPIISNLIFSGDAETPANYSNKKDSDVTLESFSKELFDRPADLMRDRVERQEQPGDKKLTDQAPDDVQWPSLSDRERLFGVKEGKLQWQPGLKYSTYPENGVFAKEARNLKVPFGGGRSGTTYIILTAAALLGESDLYQVRLACLGWMIPAMDHTFYEIMVAGKEFGLDYVEGPEGYRSVFPLSEDELLSLTGDGRFPDYYLTEDYKDEIASSLFPKQLMTVINSPVQMMERSGFDALIIELNRLSPSQMIAKLENQLKFDLNEWEDFAIFIEADKAVLKGIYAAVMRDGWLSANIESIKKGNGFIPSHLVLPTADGATINSQQVDNKIKKSNFENIFREEQGVNLFGLLSELKSFLQAHKGDKLLKRITLLEQLNNEMALQELRTYLSSFQFQHSEEYIDAYKEKPGKMKSASEDDLKNANQRFQEAADLLTKVSYISMTINTLIGKDVSRLEKSMEDLLDKVLKLVKNANNLIERAHQREIDAAQLVQDIQSGKITKPTPEEIIHNLNETQKKQISEQTRDSIEIDLSEVPKNKNALPKLGDSVNDVEALFDVISRKAANSAKKLKNSDPYYTIQKDNLEEADRAKLNSQRGVVTDSVTLNEDSTPEHPNIKMIDSSRNERAMAIKFRGAIDFEGEATTGKTFPGPGDQHPQPRINRVFGALLAKGTIGNAQNPGFLATAAQPETPILKNYKKETKNKIFPTKIEDSTTDGQINLNKTWKVKLKGDIFMNQIEFIRTLILAVVEIDMITEKVIDVVEYNSEHKDVV